MVSFNTWVRNWRNIVSWNYFKDRLELSYIISSLRQLNFERNHPRYPWITVDMIMILENFLRPSDVGFEFGSGNSTVWFGLNTKQITSVEHNGEWYNRVQLMIKKYRLAKKATVKLVKNVDEVMWSGESNYIEPIMSIKNESLDYCFVDGIFRDECILQSIPKLKHGGLLIVDNVDNYFPKNKISISVRYKRDNFSKTVSAQKMKKIFEILNSWRCIWTTCGIQDTALWIKP